MLTSNNPTDDPADSDDSSGGQTFSWDDAPHAPHRWPAATSFARRHPLGLGIAGAAIAVVLVSGLTAWGVGTTVAASYSSAASAAASPPAPGGAAAGKKAAARPLAGTRVIVIRGTIQSISGATWIVATRAGAIDTVTVDAATRYGTKKSPAAASDFAVGSAVIILEKRAGAMVLRVASPGTKPGHPTPSATPNA
jgi:hypothetical protein